MSKGSHDSGCGNGCGGGGCVGDGGRAGFGGAMIMAAKQ